MSMVYPITIRKKCNFLLKFENHDFLFQELKRRLRNEEEEGKSLVHMSKALFSNPGVFAFQILKCKRIYDIKQTN